MHITFDSNVWEKVITDDGSFATIRRHIISGKIKPYICEIAISLESIQRKARLDFFQDYEPLYTYKTIPTNDNSIHGQICISPNNEMHPGLCAVLETKLQKAKELNFKALTMTELGTVRSREIPDCMKIEFLCNDHFWIYAERLNECNSFIEQMGCGSAQYSRMKEYLKSPRAFRINDPDITPKKLSSAISEWVDGSALAAHYAYGNAVFCTEDRGQNAGRQSIFHCQNLNRLTEKFGLTVLSSYSLAQLLESNE